MNRERLMAEIEHLLPPRPTDGGVDITRLGWSYLRYLSDAELRAVRLELADIGEEREWMTQGGE